MVRRLVFGGCLGVGFIAVAPSCAGDDSGTGAEAGAGTTSGLGSSTALVDDSGTAETAAADATAGDELLDDDDEGCPPCVPPPNETCEGMGPCGCGPYVCEGTFDGDPGQALADVACLSCNCRIALDATDVYVLDDVGLGRVPKAGGTLTAVFSGGGAMGFSPRDFEVDDGTIVLSESTGLSRVGTDGAPMGSVGALDEVFGLTVDAGFVFFGRTGTGSVHRVALDAMAMDPGQVVGDRRLVGDFGDAVVVDDTVVFTAAGGVHVLADATALTPGAVTTIAPDAQAAAAVDTVAVDGDRVSFVRDDGTLGMVALGGGEISVVEDIAAEVVASGGRTSFFIEANAVRSVSNAGGEVQVHAAFGIDASPALAVDDDAVYWVACSADDAGTMSTLRSVPR